MEILNLALHNFRNYASKKIVFDKNLTVVVGANGSGKSNILEGIGYLCAVRPERVDTDLDLVKFGKSEAKIEGRFSLQEEKKKLTINIVVVDETFIRKTFYIDAIKKRFADFGGLYSIVTFQPQDLELVSGSPSVRRHHLDSFLSTLDRDYHRNILAYSKTVTRRNRILNRIQEGKARKSELDFWDGRLVEHGNYIAKKRSEFFDFLNFIENSFPGGREGELSWALKHSEVSNDKLAKNRDRDIAAGVTLSGPHRDDFRFVFRKKDLAYFGSRGEQRMAVLSLKLAELEYFQVKEKSRPILALDDIFSELDWEHREAVLSVIDKQQTIITAAEEESVPKKLLKRANLVEL